MRRFLREPLLHFLLLGAALFAAYHLVSGRDAGESGSIVITQGQVRNLALAFAKTWRREPTADELEGLVRDRVREEVYYREAMALGLDKDDIVIRRRLRQKMEFISEDRSVIGEPSQADLEAYLAAHPASFRVQPRFTFVQVFLDPEKRGGQLESDAQRLLARLRQPGSAVDATSLGDTSLLERRFTATPAGAVAQQFGEAFTMALEAAALGRWEGPIASDFGMHLVRVTERTPARAPALAEVRDDVRREWIGARRLEANERYYQELRKRYVVTVEDAGAPPR